MEIILHKSFRKEYARLQPEIKEKFKERRNLFLNDSSNPLLNNHSVDAAYPGCKSFNVTGNYRVIFRKWGENPEFLHIGTHSQLYG